MDHQIIDLRWKDPGRNTICELICSCGDSFLYRPLQIAGLPLPLDIAKERWRTHAGSVPSH